MRINKKQDPSETSQYFNNIALKIHCCRYWQFSEWECINMAFPFWRVYHNVIDGAKVIYKNKVTELKNDRIIIIPPNTAYSNEFKSNPVAGVVSEGIVGNRINITDTIDKIRAANMFDHLFIHFNLGIPYDFVNPGIYVLPVNPELLKTIGIIKNYCIEDSLDKRPSQFYLHSFLYELLAILPEAIWNFAKIDQRIFRTINYISTNYNNSLDNKDLARMVNLATNSFARLFRTNMGESVQSYIKKVRIENAQMLLHHGNQNIDSISTMCGFSDRHHFSKSFKQIVNKTPSDYRKLISSEATTHRK